MPTSSGPDGNAAWPPNNSGNNLSWDGSAVIKRYNNNPVSYYREHATLLQLADLPVLRVLPGSRPGELRLAYIDGLPGGEAIDSAYASGLLREMGRFLRRLHETDIAGVAAVLEGEGSVIVHGDFAHYNCLMSTGDEPGVNILDWECVHLGDKVEDLAWCEWQFRNSYPQHQWAVSNLFEGYGEEPGYELREHAIAARIEELHLHSKHNRENQADVKRPLHLMRFGCVEETAPLSPRYLAS